MGEPSDLLQIIYGAMKKTRLSSTKLRTTDT